MRLSIGREGAYMDQELAPGDYWPFRPTLAAHPRGFPHRYYPHSSHVTHFLRARSREVILGRAPHSNIIPVFVLQIASVFRNVHVSKIFNLLWVSSCRNMSSREDDHDLPQLIEEIYAVRTKKTLRRAPEEQSRISWVVGGPTE